MSFPKSGPSGSVRADHKDSEPVNMSPPQTLAATLRFLVGASLQGREQGYPYRCQELPMPSLQDQLKPSSYRKSSLTTPSPFKTPEMSENRCASPKPPKETQNLLLS